MTERDRRGNDLVRIVISRAVAYSIAAAMGAQLLKRSDNSNLEVYSKESIPQLERIYPTLENEGPTPTQIIEVINTINDLTRISFTNTNIEIGQECTPPVSTIIPSNIHLNEYLPCGVSINEPGQYERNGDTEEKPVITSVVEYPLAPSLSRNERKLSGLEPSLSIRPIGNISDLE